MASSLKRFGALVAFLALSLTGVSSASFTPATPSGRAYVEGFVTLATGNTIQGVAGTGTAITYTILGVEQSSSPDVIKVLAQGQLPTSTGALYTAPASTTAIVSKIFFANTTGSSVSGFKIFINGTAAANQISGTIAIPANSFATLDLDGWRSYGTDGSIAYSSPSYLPLTNISGTATDLAVFTGPNSLGNFSPPGPACNVSNQVAVNIGVTGAPTCFSLLASFLPSTTVNSIVNDTNVTGSIVAQALTLGWTGTLAKARQNATTVYTDQANTFGAFNQQFQSGTRFSLLDSTDQTKIAQFDLSNIGAGATRTVNVPNANSTTAQTKAVVASNFLTGMSAQGVFSAAQPAFSDLAAGTSTCAQEPALAGDVTSSSGSCTTVLANIPNDVIQAGDILATNTAAPSTPAAGKNRFYFDSTSKNMASKNDAGTVNHGVQTDTGASNNFLTAIADSGAVSKAQPAFSNLSGSVDLGGAQASGTLAAGRFPALTSDVTTSAGSLATTLANIPNDVPQAGDLLQTAIVAPGTPAAGKGRFYLDSTSKNISVKDDAGVVKHGVQTSTVAANQFLTGIADNGSVSKAQPNFTDLAGLIACGQQSAVTGDITSSSGSCAEAFRSFTGLSVLGRSASSSGVPTEITASADNQVLARVSSAVGFNAMTDAIHGALGGGTDHAVATTAVAGFLSANDKIKLNGVYKDAAADCGIDTTGAVDATALLQSCYDSFSSTGGRLHVSGTIKVDLASATTITISKPVITVGDGRAISVINVTHATKTLFTMATGSQGAGFEQMRISAPTAGTRTAGFAIDFGAIANVYAQQIDILFQWSGIHSGGALQFFDDLNIREGGQNAASGAAILVDSSGDRYVRRLTTDQTNVSTYAGIRVRECSSLVITDSNIIHSGNALDVVPNAGAGHQVASILSINTFYDTSSIGVNVVPATNNDSVNRVRFINCWFSTMATAGVRLGNASINVANVNSVDFVGCDFYQNPLGIDSLGVAEWSVRASRIAGNTTAGINIVQGLQAGVQAFTISDNVIGNVAGFGQNLVGITIASGTYKRYQILDNRGLETNGVSPTGTPGITDNGVVGPSDQKNVKNNMGTLIGGTQQPLSSGGAALIAGRGAITSGATETFLMTFRIAANAVSVGQVFHLKMILQAQGAGTLIFRIRSGAAGTIAGDTEISINPASTISVANQYYLVEGLVTVVALGPTATVAGSHTVFANAAFVAKTAAAEVVANVPTTAPWFITLSATASASTFTVKEVLLDAP